MTKISHSWLPLLGDSGGQSLWRSWSRFFVSCFFLVPNQVGLCFQSARNTTYQRRNQATANTFRIDNSAPLLITWSKNRSEYHYSDVFRRVLHVSLGRSPLRPIWYSVIGGGMYRYNAVGSGAGSGLC